MSNITLPAFGSAIAGQGGIFAAIIRAPRVGDVEEPPFALIVADREHEFESTWGEYGQDVAGAGSRTDGLGNTKAMADAGCHAAKRVRELQVDGHADYYLPSLGELNSAAANVPEAFDPEGVYWTSTQSSRHGAFCQGFDYSLSGWLFKDDEWRVRPFRRIPLEALTA